jgi:uncharacterized protein
VDTALLITNLTSPAVICFLIGAVAAILKSDLRVPPQVHEALSMYLLFAIGVKGGLALVKTGGVNLMAPLIATLCLGVLTPLIAYTVARVSKLDVINSAALAAHYGSVSAVTFMAALNFAEQSHIGYEPALTALLVVLEIPGIVIALMLAGWFATRAKGAKRTVRLPTLLLEALTGKSVILLGGGLLVGVLADAKATTTLTTVFITPFHGMLTFFLLEMGVVAASRFRDKAASFRFMMLYGTLVPLVLGLMGALAGRLAGLSVGGTAILATMAASASYIAAPAAVKMALPEANAGLYLTSSISITLPFNIALGIPLYFALAKWL